jgi:hypothetical protein
MTRTFGDFWRWWRASQGLPSRHVTRDGNVTLVPELVPPVEFRGIPQTRLRINDKVNCNQPTGLFRPCDRCGSNSFTVRPGAGPHAGRIVCNDCGRRSRWLSRALVEAA